MRRLRTLVWTIAAVAGAAGLVAVPPAAADFVINDDLIVDGSACIGFDCVNGEVFSFDTIRLKENNLRIKFDDTSVVPSFPANDWQITANESANGGLSKFSIEDVSGGRTPFTIEANARTHSLYVDDGGRLGLRTSTPSVEIHTIDGDTPTLRLQQDGSSGFTPQTWDVAGNETNFFIRDVTNGSALPFRIRPGAPSNSIFTDVDGDVGLKTSSPTAPLHVRTSNPNADLVFFKLESTAAENVRFDIVNTNGTWRFGTNAGSNAFTINDLDNAGAELTVNENGDVVILGNCTEVDGACADYVFEPDYELIPLAELEAFITEKKHLPNVPSTDEIKAQGVSLQRMQGRLLEKIEELVLYTLQQQKLIDQLQGRLEALEGAAATQ